MSKPSKVDAFRLRKAWLVVYADCKNPFTCHEDDQHGVIHASTKGKAVARVSLDTDIPFTELKALRIHEQDLLLPYEHPIVADLEPAEREILLHMITRGRTHYLAYSGDADVCRLKERGLLDGPKHFSWTPDDYYSLNWMGTRVAQSILPTYPRERSYV